MRTAESAGAPPGRSERRWAWAGLAGVLLVGLGLRLWGVRQGLPYVYNIDEATHFVPRAVEMFQHGLDPHYFANPPAFTYLLHLLYAAWYGGGAGARRALELNPTEVYTLARVASALLGTAALWLLYATGATAPLQGRRAPGGGDPRGRLPARLLFPPGRQRRAHAGAADARAARRERDPAARQAAGPCARRDRARARLRKQVHGWDRARPVVVAVVARWRLAGPAARRRGAWPGSCSPACSRSVHS